MGLGAAGLQPCAGAGEANEKKPDPYVLNSRGNVRASLGDWAGGPPGSSTEAACLLAASFRCFLSLSFWWTCHGCGW